VGREGEAREARRLAGVTFPSSARGRRGRGWARGCGIGLAYPTNDIPTNERSGRLLRRLGFQVEGYARDYLYIHDGWRDHILTSLTNPNPAPPVLGA
jgi:hypothetical protein